ncbi:hypothetical protein NUU61_003179 [Penicillium alfredii]|uniref:Sigma-70 region 2 family protein n=1 Tax=Penicillium alfredii TaxID=1506179 RepID=A0A9W9FU54_9EURO|nr:uncharacterized protein NUU61_003179 [Penicillium alfredii]KAJ5105832.1 hypothetical protein NUU61_003179 [Penicillium alfredii]
MPTAPDKPASSNPPEPSNMRWQFIDASNNSRSNLTQVKRHVMQEYMRQKKGDSRSSESEDDTSQHPQTKLGRPKRTRASTRKLERKDDGNEQNFRRSTRQRRAAARSKEGPPLDVEETDGVLFPESSASHPLPREHFVNAPSLPLRTSPIQSPGFLFPSQGVVDVSPQSVQSRTTDFSSLASWSSGPTTPLEFIQSPRSMMSAARTDPFNSLPLDLDLEGQKLFDFYVNDMPACSYGSHFRSTKAHNWYTAVFVPEAMKGPVAFQNTILVHAANTWAWVRSETETRNTLLHRDRALTMLREHLTNNPRDISDVAIISCLSAAALEDFDPRPGHKEISWVHMRAARQMIRARGGPATFANTRLGMLINWQDYILSGYETHGPSFFFEREPPLSQSLHNVQSMPSPPDSTSSVLSDFPPCPEPKASSLIPSYAVSSPIDELRLQCEEFLDFLRRCEQLALYHKDSTEFSPPERRTAVQETSLLFQILAAPPGARFTASGDRKQMVARLTALGMLNAALWDYRYTPDRAAAFLKTLNQAIVDSEVSMSGSVEAVLQILLACNDGDPNDWPADASNPIATTLPENIPDYSQYSPTATSPAARPWFAGRMLKIAKRLRAESWHRVNDFLFSCLTLHLQDSSVFLWEIWEAELRQEILEAPLTSYVMPSLIE